MGQKYKSLRGRIRSVACSVGSVLVLGGTLASCGTQTIVKTVTPSGGATTTNAQAPQASSSAQQAKVGDALTLKANGGEAMAVTVDQVMDPLQVGQYDQADTGQRFVGVQLTLKNVGSVAYSDSPSNGATLLSSTNEQARSQIVSGGPCGNDFGSSANIAPGDTQQGCIAFEMPVGQTPSTFQFTLNSGFGNQTGQWSLAGAATSSPSAATSATGTATSSGLPNHCSPGVDATQSVSCELASNVFYEYFTATQSGGNGGTLSAWSPATKQYYSVSCSPSDGVIKCAVSGTSDSSAEVDLTQNALSAYSPQQASAYAAGHDVGPHG